MAEHLPNVLTPISAAELAGALLAGWRTLLGETPSRQSILVLMSQSAHETGLWKWIHCFNVGNLKAAEGDGHDYTMFRCREIVKGEDVYFDPPDPATRFRAYRTLAEGVTDHLAFLQTRKRYAAAWDALGTGDPLTFAAALKIGGYYTDPLTVYARALGRYFDDFDRTLPQELEPPAIDDAERERTLARVALSLRELGREEGDEPPDTVPPPKGVA